MADDFLKKSDFASAPLAVYSCEPFAYSINKCAKKLRPDNKTASQIVSAAQYATTPADRLIQAVVTPLFAGASYIYSMHSNYINAFTDDRENSKLDKAAHIGVWATGFLPIVVLDTALIWTALAINTAIHLFPFKVISACKDNRPLNFFSRRDYCRLEYQNDPDFLNGIFSPIRSDKYYARCLWYYKLWGVNLTTIASANFADEIQAYDTELARQQFNKKLDIGSEPDERFLKHVSRLEFLEDLFRSFFDFRLPLKTPLTVDTCPLLHHLEYHASLDTSAGFDTVFSLPKDLNEADKIAELTSRYGACLRLLGCMKDNNSFLKNSMTKPDGEDAEWLQRTDPWIQRVEAVLAYTYLELQSQKSQQCKSARAK